MSREKMRAELSAENPLGSGYFYADLELPATIPQIFDAMQRARFSAHDSQFTEVSILYAPYMEGLEDMRLDYSSIEELNFLAKRLNELPDNELFIYQALFQKRYGDYQDDDLVSVKALINMTYGLDEVMIAFCVRTDEELGQFVIENGLNSDVEAIPEESRYLLDKRKIGELQRQCDDGILFNGFYIVTCDYELPKVYDGEHLPDTAHENAVFRLKITDKSGATTQISLPADYEKIRQLMESSVERYRLSELDSAIPDISKEICADLDSVGTLNQIAERYISMSNADQITFKAVLEAENITKLDEILQAAVRLDEYELSYFAADAASFYKDYLAKYLDTRFDAKWLDTLLVANEGKHLLERLGATVTDYGVISARGGHLYEIVPYDEPRGEEELADADISEEDYEAPQIGGMCL